MTASWSKGKFRKYPYYHCLKHGPSHNRDRVHEWFSGLLKSIKPSEKVIDLFVENLKKRLEERKDTALSSQRTLKKEIAKLKKKKQVLVDKNLSGVFDDDLFQEQMAKLKDEITVKQLIKSEQQIDELNVDIFTNFMRNFLANIDIAWVDAKAFKQRKMLASSIFPSGIVVWEKFNRTLNLSPAFQEIAALRGVLLLLVPPRRIELLFPP